MHPVLLLPAIGCDLDRLDQIRWDVINARNWSAAREWKQAEFPIEHSFPWSLVNRIGVRSRAVARQVANALPSSLAPPGANMLSESGSAVHHRPKIEICADWYY
ncbi:DarT ssDNA thymidine ADP-ribosyltransferase family protein [Tistrella mobilis]|uniref:DarT ssDNA thymidine ADP-ribosyltransferase family protein n=1 Tax=Tistrella mobilis TaxID=171437 RepID=UPI003556210D